MNKKGIIITLLLVLLLPTGCSLDSSRITASLFTVSVPNVVGLELQEATEKCANAGFATETVFVEADAPANTVVSTDPAANTKTNISSIVRLYCAGSKSAAVRVPNVIGKSLDDAKNSLNSQGLKIGDMIYESSDREKDTVILTDPLPGCEVSENTSINLTLSSGSKRESKLIVAVELPDVSGEIELTVYVDGELEQKKTVAPLLVNRVSFTFRGTTGKKTVDIFSDGVLYKSYQLDFDNGLVTEE